MSDLNIVPKVVDLSHYDNLQDIQKVKGAGIIGIVNKATEGPSSIDATFRIRRPVVLGAGLLYGSYHFLRPGNMVAQAEHHLNVIGDPTGLHIMADWEVPGISPADLKVWLGTIHDKTAQWPSVYSYASMLIEQLGRTRTDPVLAQTRLWVAAYSRSPTWPTQIWPRPWLWQFTGDGSGPGVHQIPGIILPGSKGIDVDAYEGGIAHADHTDDELRAEWAGGAPVTMPDLQPDPVYPGPDGSIDPPPATPVRMTGITATVFGGAGDPNRDAYDGHLITDREMGVSLPAHINATPLPQVRVFNGAKSALCPIVDVGPWNVDDPYWATGARPQAETGTDRRGRHTNHAGIDLTPATARALGIDGMGKVDWQFEPGA